MNARLIFAVKAVLMITIVIFSYKIYRIIMEPIEFAGLKDRRYEDTKVRLEQIRDAELAYKEEYGVFQGDLDQLIDFVANGRVSIVLRKDSSFQYYDRVYQQEMSKDTVVLRKIGEAPVVQKLQQKPELFGADFKAEDLRFVPYSNKVPFALATGEVDRNDVKVPVFEAKADNKDIFQDVMETYHSLILHLPTKYLAIGSLQEPTLSGNWK